MSLCKNTSISKKFNKLRDFCVQDVNQKSLKIRYFAWLYIINIQNTCNWTTAFKHLLSCGRICCVGSVWFTGRERGKETLHLYSLCYVLEADSEFMLFGMHILDLFMCNCRFTLFVKSIYRHKSTHFHTNTRLFCSLIVFSLRRPLLVMLTEDILNVIFILLFLWVLILVSTLSHPISFTLSESGLHPPPSTPNPF